MLGDYSGSAEVSCLEVRPLEQNRALASSKELRGARVFLTHKRADARLEVELNLEKRNPPPKKMQFSRGAQRDPSQFPSNGSREPLVALRPPLTHSR